MGHQTNTKACFTETFSLLLVFTTINITLSKHFYLAELLKAYAKNVQSFPNIRNIKIPSY